jgi:L-2-hydroxyglutarate oxidase LhgO
MFRHVIIGGGIVGLAVAAKLAPHGSTLLLERNDRFAAETSARNSGVVHAGMYYPAGSLKTDLCVAGNRQLWAWVDGGRTGIRARRCGKWIGAACEGEVPVLQRLAENMASRGIPYRWVDAAEVSEREPSVAFVAALESPSTGIVDVASLADHYVAVAQSHDAVLQLSAPVASVARDSRLAPMVVTTADGTEVECECVINCAGLHATAVATMLLRANFVPQPPPEYQQRFCRGRYASYRAPAGVVDRLVYPCPKPQLAGLGVHATIDLQGHLRFGPDTEFLASENAADISYAVSEGDTETFLDDVYGAVTQFMPGLQRERLSFDGAGIRPKLSAEGEPFRDFIVTSEAARGAASIVNCVGIESPGLTASPAIAQRVEAELGLPALPW